MKLSTPDVAQATRPYVKLNEIGDAVVISIGHVNKQIPERDYDTDEVKKWDDGNLIYQTRIVGIVHAIEGSPIGRMSGEDVELEQGMEVAIFVSGGKNGNQGLYKQAESDNDGVDLCDMLKFRFDRTEKASNPKWKDRKIMTSQLRSAKPEEIQTYKELCENIWKGFEEAPQISAADGGADDRSFDSNEDPF